MKLLAWTAGRALGRLGHRLLLITMATSFSFNAAAAPPNLRRQQGTGKLPIPTQPSAPPSLTQPIPSDPFHCHRTFVYKGQTLDCDTPIQRDGEKLRPILKDVPAAMSELDDYQKTQRSLSTTAYVVSGALVVALGGYIATRASGGVRFRTEDGDVNAAYLVTLGSLAVAIGAFTYGFVLYKRNETRLTAAVSAFNNARPGSPIQLEFNTGITF